MTTLASDSESPFNRNRRQERDAERRARVISPQIEEHRGDVFRSLELNREADALQGDRDKFETSQEFRDQVAGERAIRNIAITTCVFYVLIFVADLFLATPDVSRMLADKTVLFISENLAKTTSFNGLVLASAPYWLRMGAGMMLVSIWLGITYLAKKSGNEAPQQAALLQVEAGQDSLRRKLITQIWLKRGLKVGYLVLLAGFFSLFYFWDLQRAHNEAESANSKEADQTQAAFQLPTSAELFGADANNQNAGNSPKEPAAPEASLGEGESGLNLSIGMLPVYAGLWCLHFFLILLPVSPAGRELRYSRFSIAKTQKRINRIRKVEIPLSLAIGDKVLATEDEALKRRLFTITEPLFPRINSLYGRDLLILQGGTRSQPDGGSANGETRPPSGSHDPDGTSQTHTSHNGINGHASGKWTTPAADVNHGLHPGRNGNHGGNGASKPNGKEHASNGTHIEPSQPDPAPELSDDEIPPVDWDNLMGGQRAS